MIIPEATLAGLAEIIPQFPNAEDFAGFLFDSLSVVLPEQLQHLPHAADDVIGMIGIVYEDAVLINAEWIP